ncbi:MAG: hypothetical protein J6Y28_09610 [Acholeplasmatales bacterium]|nr:hypothetical protein [Methanobrevibacter sp.]MBP5446414.1 hypothetical protein [Acholeplasmatales bacterium]
MNYETRFELSPDYRFENYVIEFIVYECVEHLKKEDFITVCYNIRRKGDFNIVDNIPIAGTIDCISFGLCRDMYTKQLKLVKQVFVILEKEAIAAIKDVLSKLDTNKD